MAETTPLDPLQTAAGPGAATPAKASPDPAQVRLLAAQFESLLLSQMLRDMRSSTFDDDADTGFGGGPLSEALFSELSLALSRAGGLGLGKMLVDPIGRQTDLAAGATDASELAARLASAPMLRSLTADEASLPLATAPIPLAAQSRTFSLAGLQSPPAIGGSALSALQGRVTSAYGWREDPISGTRKFHKGADIAMPEGQDVPSARAGRVSFAGERGSYGLLVIVDHGNGVSTRYGHLSAIAVKAGDEVVAGQIVGQAGSTGRATGPHLHFEVHDEGQVVDPSSFMAPEEPRS